MNCHVGLSLQKQNVKRLTATLYVFPRNWITYKSSYVFLRWLFLNNFLKSDLGHLCSIPKTHHESTPTQAHQLDSSWKTQPHKWAKAGQSSFSSFLSSAAMARPWARRIRAPLTWAYQDWIWDDDDDDDGNSWGHENIYRNIKRSFFSHVQSNDVLQLVPCWHFYEIKHCIKDTKSAHSWA